jgi:hypothetical protein
MHWHKFMHVHTLEFEKQNQCFKYVHLHLFKFVEFILFCLFVCFV